MIAIKALLIGLFVLAAVIVGASLLGARRWETAGRELWSRLETGRRAVQPPMFAAGELDGLPGPVQRYFRTVLSEGQPLVTAVTVEHAGTFNVKEDGENWKPFTSKQSVITQRPGFVWDGRIAMLPGVPVRVHDAYVQGEGLLRPALFGLIALADLRGGGEIARGELMRYLAEAAWYPTALLPSQGVRWEGVDERSARATLDDGGVSVKLLFGFGDGGLIEFVRTDSRGRTVGGEVVPTPWEGRWFDYASREGLLVPLRGEVAWLLPAGRQPYWRGSITRLVYEFAAVPQDVRSR